MGLFFRDLALYRLPVHLHTLRQLDELLLFLFFSHLLHVALTVPQDSVDVGLMLESQLQCSIPPEQFNVHFNRAVEQLRLKQNLLCLVYSFAVECECCIATLLTWQLFYVVNELHLVYLIN